MQNLRAGLPPQLGHRPRQSRHPHTPASCAQQQRSLPPLRGQADGQATIDSCSRWSGAGREDIGQGASRCVAVQVPERACGPAVSRQYAGGVTTVMKRCCALFRDHCQSSGAGAPRPAPPSQCRTSELGFAPCHRPRGPSLPRRAPTRSGRSHPCTGGTLGGLHSIRSASGSVHGELIDSDLCEQGRCVAMPELAWGQQDRASPGSNFKRIHIVLRRHLPLKVPPAASRCPCR